MRAKFLLIISCFALLTAACTKEGDFDELKHPIEIRGNFDPQYGFPIARMSANVEDLLGLVHTSENIAVYIDENDVVAFRYSDTLNNSFSNDDFSSKGMKKSQGVKHQSGTKGLIDTIFLEPKVLKGTTRFDLFNRLAQYGTDSVECKGLYVNLTAILESHVSDPVLALIDHGVVVYFDSLHVKIKGKSGDPYEVPLPSSLDRINVTELVGGDTIKILDERDVSDIINRKPVEVDYCVRLNMALTEELLTTAPLFIKDSLKIDSISTSLIVDVDFPLQFSCRQVKYTDTMSLDLTQMDTLLDKIDKYMAFKDTGSYLSIHTENHMPLSFAMNIACLDQYGAPLLTNLLGSNNTIKGAPLKPHTTIAGSFQSAGSTPSDIVLPITPALLKHLRNTKALQISYELSTSTEGAGVPRPPVVIHKADKLDLSLFLSIAPHVHFTYSLDSNDDK